ncbi:hypothetical protein [Roseomonas fluvialis]|uniref:hypothetical protein n=1 Tax=Roseomonas fluvialis TaxID=1750527 RepID=UPI001FCD6C78|nr:hypothetical protein [Roseomonas fluvialis]
MHIAALLGATALSWVAAAAWIGRPWRADYVGMPFWTAAWLWFAPLPYVAAWFVLTRQAVARAALAVGVLALISGVAMLFTVGAMIVLWPIGAVLGCGLVGALFGLVMAAVQDEVPTEAAQTWRWAHLRGWLVAVPAFWLAFALMPSTVAHMPGVQLGLPLAALLAGLAYHAASCWALLAVEQRAVPQRRRATSVVIGTVLLAGFSIAAAWR